MWNLGLTSEFPTPTVWHKLRLKTKSNLWGKALWNTTKPVVCSLQKTLLSINGKRRILRLNRLQKVLLLNEFEQKCDFGEHIKRHVHLGQYMRSNWIFCAVNFHQNFKQFPECMEMFGFMTSSWEKHSPECILKTNGSTPTFVHLLS